MNELPVAVILPVEASVKVAVRGAGPLVGLPLKAATGAAVEALRVVLTSLDNALSVPVLS